MENWIILTEKRVDPNCGTNEWIVGIEWFSQTALIHRGLTHLMNSLCWQAKVNHRQIMIWVWGRVTLLTSYVRWNLQRTDSLHQRQKNHATLLPSARKLFLKSLVSNRLFYDTCTPVRERFGWWFCHQPGNMSSINWFILIPEVLIDLFFPHLVSMAKLLTKQENRVGFWGVWRSV